MGERMGRDMWMLSITVDPKNDTPAVLKEYAESWGSNKTGWLYLTGDEQEITALRRSLGVYDLDPKIDADRTQHAGILTFGSDITDRWAATPGLSDARQIAKTIHRITSRPMTHGGHP